MRSIRILACASLAIAAAVTAAPASAQPDLGPDVPITIVIVGLDGNTCSLSTTPRSNVSTSTLSSTVGEWGQMKVAGVSHCGTVTVRSWLTDTGVSRPTFATAAACSTTTGCTAKAAQNVTYGLGTPGLVKAHTQVTVQGLNFCFDDEWSVVGGVSAMYVQGGPGNC
jgi:hypothetical protein